MSPLILILVSASLILLWLWWRHWQRHTPAPQRRRQLWGLALLLGGTLLIWMALSGRLHWLFALIGGVMPFMQRMLALWQGYGQWRQRRQQQEAESEPRPGEQHSQSGNGGTDDQGRQGLTQAQARQILGVTDNATREEIIEAHRRLMQKVHPDRGGSDYLASQINTAKRVLLGE